MDIEIDLDDLAEQVDDVSEAARAAWDLSTALERAGDEVGGDLWGTIAVNLEALCEAYGAVLLYHSGVDPEEPGEA